MNISQLLVRTAKAFPHSPAIYYGKRLICDYQGLSVRAAGIAAGLIEKCRLQTGDRIALYMANTPEYLEILYGIWFAGMVAVPINFKLHPKEVESILGDSGAKVLFASEDLASHFSSTAICKIFAPGTADYKLLKGIDSLREIIQCRPDDLAWLFYTSGTTGRPKGVMQTHRNLLMMTMCYFSDVDTVNREDAIIYAAPMSHGAGMYNFSHVLAGARHVIPESHGFDPSELLILANEFRNVSLFAAPTMVKRLVDHVAEGDKSSDGFKTIVYGGGPMYTHDIQRALGLMGPRFVQIYGQGESPMTITALSRHHLADREHPNYAQRIASVGVAQSVVEVMVADSSGVPLANGMVGEILVRGETVMKGYWNNAMASAEALKNGWLFTGDMGSLDESGFLTLRDRSKDVIISGGSNIYPREVEEVLLNHPALKEVAVVGRPHSEWGEEVVAFVVAKPGATVSNQDLDTICVSHIARFKRPKHYIYVDELPKNSYGKILKTELRKHLGGGGSGE